MDSAFTGNSKPPESKSLVVAPEALNGRRKTDKRDTGKLCLLLVDYVLRENRDIFKVVRAPSPEQERRRAQWRQRSQFLKTRNMLAGHGRGLFQYFGHYLVAQRWWGVRAWHKLIAGLDPWIVEMLDGASQSHPADRSAHGAT